MIKLIKRKQSNYCIEMVFKSYYREFCMLSYSFLGDRYEAEDIVHDVFEKMLLKEKGLTILDLKNYISKSIKHACIKKIQRTGDMEHIDMIAQSLLDAAFNCEENLIIEERQLEIKNAIENLPDQPKKVFELCAMKGLKYQYAADTLGISINTVKSHMKKAYKELRLKLRNTYILPLFFIFFFIF